MVKELEAYVAGAASAGAAPPPPKGMTAEDNDIMGEVSPRR